MIACPICGRETSVVDTRSTGKNGARRRRRCTDPMCAGRVTTVEIVVNQFQGASDLASGHAVLVSRRLLERLQRVVMAIGGMP